MGFYISPFQGCLAISDWLLLINTTLKLNKMTNKFFVSEIMESAPAEYKSELQKLVYATLQALNIPFERVDTDEAITMDDCVAIDQKLDMKMVKTLFLCNRQQTDFYLFITRGDKPFKSKDFSHILGISRVSFAPAELLYSMLGTHIGAATVFSALLDKESKVQVVFDNDVAMQQWYGCSDGTTTGYLKIATRYIINTFMPFTRHIPKIITTL